VKELKSIFGLLVLLVGGFVLYKVFPAYWDNFKVNQMIADQAVIYTNFPKTDDEIKVEIAQKAQDYDVAIAPEQVVVTRGGGNLTINLAYTVHIDMPGYPFDLNFNDSSTNHNIME
jgi:Domain of unknown function (DUF4845)